MKKMIGGVVVSSGLSPDVFDSVRRVQRAVVSEVIEQSTSLSLDDTRDRRVLVRRLRFALGLDK